jgi:predicted AAA+ superfamily ATPase
MEFVLIKQGNYREMQIAEQVFPVVKQFKTGARGSYITVDGTTLGSDFTRPIRIKCARADIVNVEQDAYDRQLTALAVNKDIVKTGENEFTEEQDEKRMDEIEERFEILNEMTGALKSGDIRAMIVTGPPGVGKSYGVQQTLEQQSIFEDVASKNRKFEVVKGAMTALGLYAKLYEFSDAGNVLVFDDCDSVLMDDLALNILKAALDSGKKRKIFWNADSAKLRAEGIPNSFEFKGSACFITNIKFENVKSKRMQDHLEALMSRCHYLDLTLDTMRDKYLRIKQIARTGKLFEGYNFEKEDEQEVLDFMMENKTKLREMSLRMVLKVSDLKKISAERWKSLAESTCMKRG